MVYLKHPFIGFNGAVSSEHYAASLAGLRVLEAGGNAVDAAVAVSFTLASTLPHLNGLGGDFFALVYKDGRVYFIDGSGPAPRGLDMSLLAEKGYDTMPREGPYTVTVPGMVDAVYTMWNRLGTMEWETLIAPAIKSSMNAPVSRGLARAYDRMRDSLLKYEPTRRGLSEVEFAFGSRIGLRGLSRALQRIAEDHRDFYEGEVAGDIVESIRATGGVLDYDDLKSYRARVSEPLRLEIGECSLYEMPPPTQGATTLHMIYLLSKRRNKLEEYKPNSAARIKEHFDSALKAYAIRDKYITDPDFMEIDPYSLTSPTILEELEEATPHAEGPNAGSGDTTFFVTADGDGNIVAGIQSLYHPFGSKIMTSRFQIFLNNRASDFRLSDTHVNRLEPGKRTLHTLSSLVMSCGDDVIVFGASGGHFRPQQHAWFAVNNLVYGMDVQEAIEYPRALLDLSSRRFVVETGLETPSYHGFKPEHYPYPGRTGVAASLLLDASKLWFMAGNDPRGDGIALGPL